VRLSGRLRGQTVTAGAPAGAAPGTVLHGLTSQAGRHVQPHRALPHPVLRQDYRVTFSGRFLADGAVGTLRARMVWRERGKRSFPCVSGTQNWWRGRSMRMCFAHGRRWLRGSASRPPVPLRLPRR
jgi:hypothetical protein